MAAAMGDQARGVADALAEEDVRDAAMAERASENVEDLVDKLSDDDDDDSDAAKKKKKKKKKKKSAEKCIYKRRDRVQVCVDDDGEKIERWRSAFVQDDVREGDINAEVAFKRGGDTIHVPLDCIRKPQRYNPSSSAAAKSSKSDMEDKSEFADALKKMMGSDEKEEPQDDDAKAKKQEPPVSSFALNQPVRARFDGGDEYFPGKISAVLGNGTYNIAYDDGDREDGVAANLIEAAEEKIAAPPQKAAGRKEIEVAFSVGQRVQARFGGGDEFYPGKISAVSDDGTYSIAYDDGDREDDVAEKFIKAVAAPDSSASFVAGQCVQARFGGGDEYFPGKIAAVLDGERYSIAYDDGDREDSVAAGFIKSLPSPINNTATDAVEEEPQGGDESVPVAGEALRNGNEIDETIEESAGHKMQPDDEPVDEDIVEEGSGKEEADEENQDPESEPVDEQNAAAEPEEAQLEPESDKQEIEPERHEPEPEPEPETETKPSPEMERTPESNDAESEKPEEHEPFRFDGPSSAEEEDIRPSLELLRFQLQSILRSKARVRGGASDFLKARRAVFKQLDNINGDAFVACVRACGMDISQENAQCLFEEVSGRRGISAQSLEAFATKSSAGSFEEKMRLIVQRGSDLVAAFRRFDVDGSGTISVDELEQVVNASASEKEALFSSHEAAQIVKIFDTNKDGVLSLREFLAFAAPDYGLNIATPFGGFYMHCDPSQSIRQLKSRVRKRAAAVFGATRSLGARFALAKHFGSIRLEPPKYFESMPIVSCLSQDDQVFTIREGEAKYQYVGRNAISKRRSTSETKTGGTVLPAEQLNRLDKKMRIAVLRLKDIFDMIDQDDSGAIDADELEKAIRNPRARKLVSGSAALSKLFKPGAFKALDENDDGVITFDEFVAFALPSAACAMRAKSKSKSPRRRSSAAHRKIRKTVASMRTSRGPASRVVSALKKTYADGGVEELAREMEKKMGRDQIKKLSQHARARIFTGEGTPRDMTSSSGRGDEKTLGIDPSETQQWVNSKSSNEWLRLRGNEAGLSKESAIAYMPIDLSTGRVDSTVDPDPATWGTRDVRKWIVTRVELPQYQNAFARISGKRLLSIRSEAELEKLDVGSKRHALHRKKILIHIQNLQRVRGKSFAGKDPVDWSIPDVLQWLADAELEKYAAEFKANSVDGELLLTLSSTDLELYMKIRDAFDRDRLVGKIRALRQRSEKHHAAESYADRPPDNSTRESAASSRSSDPLRWTVGDVCKWLQHDCGYGKYCAAFERDQVDGELLLGLTKEELGELGVANAKHVDNILFSIGDLRARAGRDDGGGVVSLEEYFLKDIEEEMRKERMATEAR